MKSQEQAKVLKALADVTRLKILSLLPARPICKDMYNVNELVEEIGSSQPNISRHLRILKEAGLVDSRKACSSVYYWRTSDKLKLLCRDMSVLWK